MEHSSWLNTIKNKLKASYVSYARYKDSYQLKVIVNGEAEYFDLTGEPKDVTHTRYIELIQQLKKFYGQV